MAVRIYDVRIHVRIYDAFICVYICGTYYAVQLSVGCSSRTFFCWTPTFCACLVTCCDIQWTFNAHSVPIQWTFTHSVNIQWTLLLEPFFAELRPFVLAWWHVVIFSEHSVPIQCPSSEHSLIQWTFSELFFSNLFLLNSDLLCLLGDMWWYSVHIQCPFSAHPVNIHSFSEHSVNIQWHVVVRLVRLEIVVRLVAVETLTLSTLGARSQSNGRERVGYHYT
jgi:hypothetical protein